MLILKAALLIVSVALAWLACIVWGVALEKPIDDRYRQHTKVNVIDIVSASLLTALAICLSAFSILF